MLTFVLFGAVFSTAVWLAYSFRFISVSLSGMSFLDAGITNVLLYAAFVFLPIFVIWAIYGFICQQIYNRSSSRQMFRLFSQLKKNQEYSDLLARIMLETEQNIKNSFMLSRFDILISDMNELLSEFLQRERLVSAEQIESLWVKVQNGGKWAFGKVVIENYNRQPTFRKKVYTDASSDNMLAGTIMEFCARYQTLIALLEKHDKEKIFINVIETGVLGKVYAVLAPVSDEIRRTRESFSAPAEDKMFAQTEIYAMPENLSQDASPKKGFFDKIKSSIYTATNSADFDNRDEFSMALERSFSVEETPKEEPVFEQSKEALINDITEADVVTDTQVMLDNLKKEWHEMEPKIQTPSEEILAYPFGGWTDADNYQK